MLGFPNFVSPKINIAGLQKQQPPVTISSSSLVPPTMKLRPLAPLILCLFSAIASAEVKFSPLFTDHAVLQRDRPVPVWGTSAPGEKVTVRFAGQQVSAISDATGAWHTELAPLTGNSDGKELSAEGPSSKATLQDVVVGEVWLCSGQSNMEWPLKNSPNVEKVLAEANLPLIRQYKVKNTSVSAPASTVAGRWIPASPDTAGAFTAVGYYFAKDLQPKLEVPIGIINSTWGGTRIESWLSPESLTKFPAVAEQWKKTLAALPARQAEYAKKRAAFKAKAQADKAAGRPVDPKYPTPPPGPGTKEEPSGLFNGMIAPLVPYAVRGIMWYQGEGNTGGAAGYAKFLPELITAWRARWEAPETPFYVVQLPNFKLHSDGRGTAWAEMRQAQAQALSLPATGLIVTIDIGTPDNGHPPDKSAFGQRAARLAEVEIYKTLTGDATGPLAKSATAEANAVRVEFDDVSSGLFVRGDQLAGFELAGADDKFVTATAKIDGRGVLVAAEGIRVPTAVRYGWMDNPPSTLYNGIGLPAAPFELKVKN